MGIRCHVLWIATLATACGSGGGGSGNTGGGGGGSGGETPLESLTSNLQIVSQSPEEGATQLAVAQKITVSFDGPLAEQCLQDIETWLQTDDGDAVAGTFSTVDDGRTAMFTPNSPLAESTDYVFQVSPLTCDRSGRILETAHQIRFRTVDTQPPTLELTSVLNNATSIARNVPIHLDYDEALDPDSVDETSVRLLDLFGGEYALSYTVTDSRITATPLADLAGNRTYILEMRQGSFGVTDVAGNAIETTTTIRFTTADDTGAPVLLSVRPDGDLNVSPAIQVVATFSESIDPFSVEPSTVTFRDEFNNLIPFTTYHTADQCGLRLVPTTSLIPGRDYIVFFATGAAAVTDVTGNALDVTTLVQFTAGSDVTAPTVSSTLPVNAAENVSITAQPLITFNEALDTTSVGSDTVKIEGPNGDETLVIVTENGDTTIRIVPVYDFEAGSQYTLTLLGGVYGVRDAAGNPLASDITTTFTTTLEAEALNELVQPPNGNIGVPTNTRPSIVFSSPLEATSVSSSTIYLTDASHALVAGTVELSGADRVVRFVPSSPLATGEWFTLTIKGGFDGVLAQEGNQLRDDVVSSFRTSFNTDQVVPTVTLTLNETSTVRNADLTVPTWGFTFDVTVTDDVNQGQDYGSVEILFTGTAGPTQQTVYRTATVARTEFQWRVPQSLALPDGEYSVRARATDLAGNASTSNALSMDVRTADTNSLPFERTQVIWARTDQDRDGSGLPDLDDDLVALGLMAAGDPAGTNARMRQVMIDGILGQANLLFGRTADGDLIDNDSMPLRVINREPLGLTHMQMHVGGFDPSGTPGRTYGDESTGVLGRALYDYRNSDPTERNTSSTPALGVFPAEMFLFQARQHIQVYPSFLTTFARKFINLSPHMGGTPVGTDPLDATVTDPSFDYASGSVGEKARYDQIFEAADDWATVFGIILAHEIGHSVGLVAPGSNGAAGLHGDSSLHNEFSTVSEVMASAVGYEAMVSVPYAFRDLNSAYLRQRILLR